MPLHLLSQLDEPRLNAEKVGKQCDTLSTLIPPGCSSPP